MVMHSTLADITTGLIDIWNERTAICLNNGVPLAEAEATAAIQVGCEFVRRMGLATTGVETTCYGSVNGVPQHPERNAA